MKQHQPLLPYLIMENVFVCNIFLSHFSSRVILINNIVVIKLKYAVQGDTFLKATFLFNSNTHYIFRMSAILKQRIMNFVRARLNYVFWLPLFFKLAFIFCLSGLQCSYNNTCKIIQYHFLID